MPITFEELAGLQRHARQALRLLGAEPQPSRVEDLEGALEDVLEAWDRYQQVLGDCEDKAITDAKFGLEAEIEGARIVLNAGGAR